MDLEQARRRTEKLMAEHGLEGWTFAFDRAVRRAGACHYAKRMITLSSAITALNPWSQVGDTARHEIAHALVGKDVKAHGPEWKAAALRVGARPQRCAPDTTQVPPGRWQATCQCPGRVFHRQLRPHRHKRFWCKACKQILKYLRVH